MGKHVHRRPNPLADNGKKNSWNYLKTQKSVGGQKAMNQQAKIRQRIKFNEEAV